MKQNIEEVLNRGERLDRELMGNTVWHLIFDCWLCHEQGTSQSEPHPRLHVRAGLEKFSKIINKSALLKTGSGLVWSGDLLLLRLANGV